MYRVATEAVCEVLRITTLSSEGQIIPIIAVALANHHLLFEICRDDGQIQSYYSITTASIDNGVGIST